MTEATTQNALDAVPDAEAIREQLRRMVAEVRLLRRQLKVADDAKLLRERLEAQGDAARD